MPASAPTGRRSTPSLSSYAAQVNRVALLSGIGRMAGSPDDAEHPPASTVSITVVSVKPVKFGKIFALASVEIDIDGVLLVLHRVRAIRVQPMGTRIDLPMFRDENGVWRNRTPRDPASRSAEAHAAGNITPTVFGCHFED
jgi:hypothetical protein